MPDKKDHCGLFGIFGHSESVRMTYTGLFAQQHRGAPRVGQELETLDPVEEGDGVGPGDGRPYRPAGEGCLLNEARRPHAGLLATTPTPFRRHTRRSEPSHGECAAKPLYIRYGHAR